MVVQLAFCFIHVVDGYVNVAQITKVYETRVCIVQSVGPLSRCIETGDKSPEDFLKRVQETCGGKRG